MHKSVFNWLQSNCVDSQSSNLFSSYGRKKREAFSNSTDYTTLESSAVIKVIAEGEDLSEPSAYEQLRLGKS